MTIATMAASLFAGCGEQTQNVGGGTETGNQAASGEKETMNIHLNGIDEDYKMQKAIEEIQTMSEYQTLIQLFQHRLLLEIRLILLL